MKLRTTKIAAFSLIAMAPFSQSVIAATLEEVVVTAQKRAESSQDIPIAISAMGEQQLEDTGFDGISDLTMYTPSMQFGNFGPIAFVSMRGIGSENTTAGGDPGVAMHIDGIYMGRPVATMFTAFDMERVEILRGPQGTLYGRNATGGSINLITKKPTDELGGEVDFTYGDYDWMRIRGAANVPITDSINARIVAFKEERDGYTENSVSGGTEANDADNYGYRGHLNFEFSDRARLLLSASYVKTDGVGAKSELREDFPGSTTGEHLAGPPGWACCGGPQSGVPADWDFIVDGEPLVNDLEPLKEGKEQKESSDDEFTLYAATFELDFETFTFKSITGYNETSFDSIQDGDQSPKALAGTRFSEDAEQFSQEFQLLSNSDGPLQWIAGLYYFDQEASRRSSFFLGRYDSFATEFGVPYGFDVGGDVDSESVAVFSQLTYQLTDSVNLTGGIRYTEDEKEGTNFGYTFFPPAYEGDLGESWDEVTYRLAVDWQVWNDALLYASYSTGYKSGGVNQVTNPNVDNPIYDPEFVDALEFGLKSTLLDGSMQLNASVYRNEYDDLQFQVFGAAGPEAFNAEGATVQGLEVELLAALSDALTLNASLGVTDSEFDDQVVSGVQLGGNQVQRTPDLTYSIGGSYEWLLQDAGAIRLRIDYSYTDEIYYTAFNRDGGFADPGGSDLADDYENLNARLFWYSPSGDWTVELSATNLTDEEQEGNVFRGIGFLDVEGGGGPEQVSYNPPRQVALRVGYMF